MIQLSITKTARGFSKNDKWNRYDNEEKTFNDIKSAKKYLEETYGNHKRVPMYQDKKDGKSEQVGWVYSFRNYDYDNGKRYFFIEQHWVSFFRIEQINPTKK